MALPGRVLALLDGAGRLPVHVWFESNPTAHDQRFWPSVESALRAGDLLLVHLGFTHFNMFAEVTRMGVVFTARAKTNLAFTAETKTITTTNVRDFSI